MHLSPSEVHIWSANLTAERSEEEAACLLLSPDECKRANRFRFDKHRRRFILARSYLRQILSIYTNIAPGQLQFVYSKLGKPSLALSEQTHLEFNLAHSEELAVFAIRLDYPIGIDLEKIQQPEPQGIAERFFSLEENSLLSKLSGEEKTHAFYSIWSRKEAIIKAIGHGLSIPLSSFDVSLKETVETIRLENQLWYLLPLTLDPAFKAALASNQPIQQISYWHFSDHGYKLDSISQF